MFYIHLSLISNPNVGTRTGRGCSPLSALPALKATSLLRHVLHTTMSSQPRYVAIAQRKQAGLAAAIPAEWRLPAHLIPEGMLSISESITVGPKKYQRVSVMDIPRTCGLLTSKELEITEKYDVRGLVAEMTEGRVKAEDVVRGFCKVCIFRNVHTIAKPF